jgi:hypothetical protein
MFWPKLSRVKKLMFAVGLKTMYDFVHKNTSISLIFGILFIEKVKERKRLVQRYGYQGAGIIKIQFNEYTKP